MSEDIQQISTAPTMLLDPETKQHRPATKEDCDREAATFAGQYYDFTPYEVEGGWVFAYTLKKQSAP